VTEKTASITQILAFTAFKTLELYDIKVLCTFTYIIQIYNYTSSIKVKVKKVKAIPVIGCGSPEGCETSKLPHFLDNQLTNGGEAVSLTCRPPFTPRATVWLERLGQLKNPMTSSGCEPTTFCLVAQCLNQLCYSVPPYKLHYKKERKINATNY
jgi:hypothetical protein